MPASDSADRGDKFRALFHRLMIPPALHTVFSKEAGERICMRLAKTFAPAHGQEGRAVTVRLPDGSGTRDLSAEARDYAASLYTSGKTRSANERDWMVGAFLLERLAETMLPAFRSGRQAHALAHNAWAAAIQAAAVLGQDDYLDLDAAALSRLELPPVRRAEQRVTVIVSDASVTIHKTMHAWLRNAGADRAAGPTVQLDTAMRLHAEADRLVATPLAVSLTAEHGLPTPVAAQELARSWLHGLLDALLGLLLGAVRLQHGPARLTAEGVVFEIPADGPPPRQIVASHAPGLSGWGQGAAGLPTKGDFFWPPPESAQRP